MIIKFNNSDVAYDVDLSFGGSIGGGERVEIIGDCPQSTAGFKVYDEAGNIKADYSAFKTIYRLGYAQGKYQLSNDGSVWHLPDPEVVFLAGFGGELSGKSTFKTRSWANITVPTPVANEGFEFEGWSPEIPTEGEIKSNVTYTAIFRNVAAEQESALTAKLNELAAANSAIIEAGVDVTLTDGSVEHFSLSATDQMNITNAVMAVSTGATQFPWHPDGAKCKFYSAEDIILIGEASKKHVTYYVTLYRDTVDWVKSLTNPDEIAAVTFGTIPPEEFQSEVLQWLLLEKEDVAE